MVIHSPDPIYGDEIGGVLRRAGESGHRTEDYDEERFDLLVAMQEQHFWYRGRHRFLQHAFRRTLNRPESIRAIDLGGGCGGWVNYLDTKSAEQIGELALGDSSMLALELAGSLIGTRPRYLIDLYDLGWTDRWDVVFLLDVIEHLDDDEAAITQAAAALSPGGTMFITTPAFPRFWSWTDEIAHHKRRYVKRDFHRLASACGLEVERVRYFHFFLSPLLLATRLRRHDLAGLSAEEVEALVEKQYEIPSRPINSTLAMVFGAETPIGWTIPFPWGTSVLAVLRKPQ